MSEFYGNPHKLQVQQCATNLPTWTDSTITAGSTKIRKVHIDEIRSFINTELTRRGLTNVTYTDPTITAGTTKRRKVHIDELRAALSLNLKKGNCPSDTLYCPQDTSGCMDFTDSTITAGSTKIRKVHVDELRSKLQALMTTCICEAEHCKYCADCGYFYNRCSHAGVACDDHKYNECHHSMVAVYNCSSINLSSVTTYPYKASSCTSHPSYSGWGHVWRDPTCTYSTTAWNGYLPWAMCNYTPPGSNWGTCTYQGGQNHGTWNCKCNPYTWP